MRTLLALMAAGAWGGLVLWAFLQVIEASWREAEGHDEEDEE